MPGKKENAPKPEKSPHLRADKVLKWAFPWLSRRHVVEAIESGLVLTKAGKKVVKGTKCASIQDLDTSRLQKHLESISQQPFARSAEIEVVFENDDFWVVNKPAGVASHPLGLFDHNTLTHWAYAQDKQIAAEFPECQPTITPHRLDTGTSGLIIVAKKKAVYDQFREFFRNKQIQKSYLAWVWGSPEKESWSVNRPIATVGVDGARVEVSEEGRPAVSHVTVVKRESDRTLVRVDCETGVTHQVRVHLAFSGYPLLGDKTYDPLFETRSEKPAFHQLDAIELITPLGVFKKNPAAQA